MRHGWRLALFIALLSVPGHVSAQTEVGAVSRVQGDCVGIHEGARRALNAGLPVYLKEEVSTATAAKLEITFADGTLLTLGEQARIVIDAFVYNPTDGLGQFLVTTSGPFRMVSGALKQPTATIEVDTPTALIGVRGTDFWGGPIDGRYGVFLIEGTVTISNNAGAVTLDQPGEGVNLDGPNVAPSPVTSWSVEKAARALGTVTFN